VPWAFVRPEDPSVLTGRPLLDVGAGDGQTLRALVGSEGLVVGLEKTLDVLRAAHLDHPVCAHADALPVASGSIGAVLAADLFHHIDELQPVLREVARVLRRDGRLIAWWYSSPAHEAPDAPRYTRGYEEVTAELEHAGFSRVSPLALTAEAGPPTVGVDARL